MDAALLLRTARQRSGLSVRELARRAGTSHSTLLAYEAGRVAPTVPVLDRIVRAAGLHMEVALVADAYDEHRGQELVDVLTLADQFPARHDAEPARARLLR